MSEWRPRWVLHRIDGDVILVTPTEKNGKGRFEYQIWRINLDCPPSLRPEFGMTYVYRSVKSSHEYVSEIYRMWKKRKYGFWTVDYREI